jgi:DNA-binding beta-propeller fold protein YncE
MRLRALLGVGVIVLPALFGCAPTPVAKKDYSDLVWPLPPDPPRIKFVATFHGQSDLSGRDEFKAMLLGEEDEGLTLRKPYGVTASADGKRIYVTDTKLRGVLVFDLEKKELHPFRTDAQGGMINPLEIRLDKRGRIFVTDSERKEILVFDQTGKTLMALGKKEAVGRPTGLALDEARNRLYVADTVKHRIVVYDMEGKFLFAFGERGSEPGQLNFPVNLAVDRNGDLLVADTGNFRIQIFDSKGNFRDTFGEVGDTYGTFARPKGVALDSDGHIYAVDAAFNNFQIFNDKGQLLLFVGSLGREPGMFWLPTGVYIDPMDRIYVADSINERIQVFQYLKEKKGGSIETSAK